MTWDILRSYNRGCAGFLPRAWLSPAAPTEKPETFDRGGPALSLLRLLRDLAPAPLHLGTGFPLVPCYPWPSLLRIPEGVRLKDAC